MTLRLATLAAGLFLASASFASARVDEPARDATPAKKQEPKAQEKADQKAPVITLAVGDAAPALTIEKWVKGTPVASFEKGKVYVVEFWATWCDPCVRGMPHLSELQKKYRDQGLTVIGVTAVDSRGNSLEKVEAMVAEKGDGMGYTVAWDKERTTNSAYMKAAGRNTIPCSFLVDQDGKVAYIGHPAQIDATLELVMAKKHDLAELATRARHEAEVTEKAAPLQKAYVDARNAKDWPAAVAALDAIVALDVEKFWGNVVARFNIVLGDMKDPARACADARAFFAGAGAKQWNAMHAIAWTLVDPKKPVEKPDLAFALELATKAVELTKSENPFVLDTLARVHFVRGELDKAIENETKAAALDKQFEKTRDEYKAAKK